MQLQARTAAAVSRWIVITCMSLRLTVKEMVVVCPGSSETRAKCLSILVLQASDESAEFRQTHCIESAAQHGGALVAIQERRRRRRAHSGVMVRTSSVKKSMTV